MRVTHALRGGCPGSLANYGQKWVNTFGLGEESPAVRPDNRNFTGGRFNLSAVPFKTGSDFSVFDHLKYIAVSSKVFPVPTNGTLVMSSDITATTPGTVDGLIQQGVYGPSGTWLTPSAPPFPPDYHAAASPRPAGRRRDERGRFLHRSAV